MTHTALALISSTLAAAPNAVTLFTGEPTPPVVVDAPASVPFWVWLALGAIVLAISGAISIMAWRGRWRDPPATRAASHLAKNLGISGDSRRILERMAQALATEPVTLLLSESAFERAIEAIEHEPGALQPKDKAALLALRATVFGYAQASNGASPADRVPLNIAA